MKVSDVATGLVLLVCAIAIFVYARGLPAIPGQPYGAGAFPTVIALGLGGFSALLAWRGFEARRRARPREPLVALAPWTRDPRTAGNFVLALLAVLVYVFASETVGFVLLSIAILLLLFWRTGVRPLTGLWVAVVMSLALQIGFSDFLRVPLPRGLLDGILW
jgi:putative tricarboxylic transport membrane protein